MKSDQAKIGIRASWPRDELTVSVVQYSRLLGFGMTVAVLPVAQTMPLPILPVAQITVSDFFPLPILPLPFLPMPFYRESMWTVHEKHKLAFHTDSR